MKRIATVLFLVMVAAAPAYVNGIGSPQAFKKLSRTYQRGKLAGVPHVLFAVERSTSKVYFADAAAFDFHYAFAKGIGLTSVDAKTFFHDNYSRDDRPLILGNIGYLKKGDRYFFEFLEADGISIPLVMETFVLLKATLPGPPAFKPSSLGQMTLLQPLTTEHPELSVMSPEELTKDVDVEVFRPGTRVGQLKLNCCKDIDTELTPTHIPVLDTAPVSLPPVSGVITVEASSPLSHVHMLARSWDVPDVRIRNAQTKYAAFDGKWVRLDVKRGGRVQLREATPAEIVKTTKQAALKRPKLVPRGDLTARALMPLLTQRRTDVIKVGAKSANLGEISRLKGVDVPAGVAIPFVHYLEFFTASGAAARVRSLMADPANADPVKRKAALATIREQMQAAPFDAMLRAEILSQCHALFKDQGVFVRSSTNAEDLPGFNGAGLYTSVPNVKGDDALIEAVKTVWASVWNFEAFEARTQAGIDHFKVYGGVLIQLGVNADAAGVLITRNPFMRTDDGSIFINAKRGLGIRVVNGHKVPEQLLFDPKSGAIRLLTRSEESVYLTFDAAGGVREAPVPAGGQVLSEALVRQIVRAATAIEAHLGGVAQDIEWVAAGTTVAIVQTRPYVE